VGHPTPYRTTSDLVGRVRPARLPQLGALVVKRLESAGLGKDLGVRAEVLPGPDYLAGLEIEPFHPAIDAELAAGGADDDPILDHEGRHRRRFALPDISDLSLPHLPPRLCVHGDRMPVKEIVDDLSVGVERASVDHVAARHPDRIRAHVGTVFPLEWISL